MEEVNSPSSGIKDYIIECRKKGYTDSSILNILQQAKWPEDIIKLAIKEADAVIAPVKEPEITPSTKEENKPAEVKKQPTQVVNQTPNDLFTKPPIGDNAPQPQQQEVKQKKKFSVLSLIAFFLSPIPFIGLGISMLALEDINKNKKTGLILGILDILISLASVLFVLFIFYQIFTMPPDELTGFSKLIVEKFKIFG